MLENIQIIDVNTTVGTHPAHRLDTSVERLVSEMDKHNISGSLMLSLVGIFHDSIIGNSITLEAARGNNRLIPVATINPINYFGEPADLQAIRAQGFRIFKFYPDEQGWAISSSAFSEVLKQLTPLKVPIFINAVYSGAVTEIGRMTADYPAPVIICSISLDTLSEALSVMKNSPNVMVETHGLHVPGGLELLSSRVGAERIVFGSGAPMRSIASTLHYILSSELSDEEKRLVLGGNIKRVLEAG